jgi:hypothetical protein
MRRFGSHHRACAIRDHGLRGGPRIEDRECPAGHCLPPAALNHTRPRGKHGMQRLPHDGVLTAELQCQGAQRAPLQLSAALEALPVPTLGMCTRPLEALPQGQSARLPEVPDGLPVHGKHGQDQRLLRGKALREAALVDARPACRARPPPPPYSRERTWGCWRQGQFLGNIQRSGVRHAMTDSPPNARKSHLAPAPAQRATRGSVTPLRGLMTVSFTPR